MHASVMSIPSGRCARFPSASLTWKNSENTPFLMLENFQPASIPPECMANPACASSELQSGVMAGTSTRSPGWKSRTSSPTETTSAQHSCPRIISCRSPTAPSQTVCTSEVQTAAASGRQTASIGPQTGFSFSTHPTFPISSIAKPFIYRSLPSIQVRIAFAEKPILCKTAGPYPAVFLSVKSKIVAQQSGYDFKRFCSGMCEK